jgi:hypothetical protein
LKNFKTLHGRARACTFSGSAFLSTFLIRCEWSTNLLVERGWLAIVRRPLAIRRRRLCRVLIGGVREARPLAGCWWVLHHGNDWLGGRRHSGDVWWTRWIREDGSMIQLPWHVHPNTNLVLLSYQIPCSNILQNQTIELVFVPISIRSLIWYYTQFNSKAPILYIQTKR